MTSILWMAFFILALLGAYHIIEHIAEQSKNKHVYKKTLLKMSVFFIPRIISVGALMGLIGYGVGYGISYAFAPNGSFAGIVSLELGFTIWAGFCGSVIGFSMALQSLSGE